MYISCEEFMERKLFPIPGKSQGVFVSYNSIFGYVNGTTKFEAGDVMVTVRCGYIFQASNIVHFERDKNANLFRDVIQKSYRGDTPAFMVVYAGLRTFRKAVECLAGIKKNNPRSLVYVLTCDCEIERKNELVNMYSRDNAVDGFILAERCGGGCELLDFIKLFIRRCKEDAC